MKVKDIMSKQIDYVPADMTVRGVAEKIFGRGINGVPVCKGKKVVGFITEKDILRKFFPSMQEFIEDRVRATDFEAMEDQVEEILQLNAEDIMSPNPTTVTPDTPLMQAESEMLTKKVGRLPVVNRNNILVGMISKGDIFKAIVGDNLVFEENQDYNDWLSKNYYQAVDIKDRMQHEIPDLLAIFQKHQVLSVLDIGCGTGDHSIELAKKGFSAIATDRSQAMIQEARRRSNDLSQETKDKLQFLHGETYKLLPKLKLQFDAILFMGNTLSHNPHRYKKLIQMTAEMLSPKGVMIFQITNLLKVLKMKDRFLSFSFAKVLDGTTTEYGFLEFYDLPNRKKETILKTFFVIQSNGLRWKYTGVRNSLFAYVDSESIVKILKSLGFKKISLYGGSFDGKNWDYLFKKPFKPLESDWLNIVAQK